MSDCAAELGAVIDVASPEGEPIATGELTGIAPTGMVALSGEWLIEGAYLELGDDREVWVPEDALWRRVRDVWGHRDAGDVRALVGDRVLPRSVECGEAACA